MMALNLYFEFGLNIYSNYQWSVFLPLEREIPGRESITIEVLKKNGPGPRDVSSEISPVAEKGKQVIYFQNKNLGSLSVYYGQKAELTPLKRLREKSERLLLNWGLAALLHQKGYVVLRGTQLSISGKGVLIMGPEDAQERMIRSCLRLGGEVLSQKMSVISFLGDQPYMIPSSQANVTQENSQTNPLLWKEIRLDNICFLHPEASEKPGLVSAFEAFRTIFHSFYLKLEASHEHVMVVHFRNIEKLLNKINVYQIKPWGNETALNQVADHLSVFR